MTLSWTLFRLIKMLNLKPSLEKFNKGMAKQFMFYVVLWVPLLNISLLIIKDVMIFSLQYVIAQKPLWTFETISRINVNSRIILVKTFAFSECCRLLIKTTKFIADSSFSGFERNSNWKNSENVLPAHKKQRPKMIL